MDEIDLRILKSFNCDFDPPWAGPLADFAGRPAFGAILLLLLWLPLAVIPSRRPVALRLLLAALLGLGVIHGLREAMWHWTPRERPGNKLPREKLLKTPEERATCASRPEALVIRTHVPQAASFPSSNAITTGVLATVFLFANRWLGLVAALYSLLDGLIRLWWGKHWPSDIAGSYVLAALVGWGSWRVAGPMAARLRASRAARKARKSGNGPQPPSSAPDVSVAPR